MPFVDIILDPARRPELPPKKKCPIVNASNADRAIAKRKPQQLPIECGKVPERALQEQTRISTSGTYRPRWQKSEVARGSMTECPICGRPTRGKSGFHLA